MKTGGRINFKDIDKPDDKPSYNFLTKKSIRIYECIFTIFHFDNKSICYKDENNDDEGRKLKEDTLFAKIRDRKKY